MQNLKNYQNSNYFASTRKEAAGLTVEDIKRLAKTDNKFKEAMGSDLKTIDERTPIGYVAHREDNTAEISKTDTSISKDTEATSAKSDDVKTNEAQSNTTNNRETIDIPEDTSMEDESQVEA